MSNISYTIVFLVLAFPNFLESNLVGVANFLSSYNFFIAIYF